jgi:hypothetical protein
MQTLSLIRVGLMFFSLGAVGACSAPAQQWGGPCEQDADCIDSTCQADSSGQRSCIKSCSAAGTWACNRDASAVYHCDGKTFTQHSACSPCAVGPASSSFGYIEGLAGVFYCDAQTRSRTTFPLLKIPFALPGEPCALSGGRDLCFIDDMGNRECSKSGYACAVGKGSVLSCVGGRWEASYTCTDGKACDLYQQSVGGGPSGVFPTFQCIG